MSASALKTMYQFSLAILVSCASAAFAQADRRDFDAAIGAVSSEIGLDRRQLVFQAATNGNAICGMFNTTARPPLEGDPSKGARFVYFTDTGHVYVLDSGARRGDIIEARGEALYQQHCTSQ